MTRWAVVLAGGVGSRFWPLSTPARPKQLLPLVEDSPMLQSTLRRLEPIIPLEHTLVLTGEALAASITSLLRGLPPENVIVEPRPAGTAAAITWAALEITQRGGAADLMVCVHADWAIRDADGFRAAILRAAKAAERTRGLITIGVVPSRADPGFGYIEPGTASVEDPQVRRVARFVEKPDRDTAARMCREGYLWNSGIFVWRADDFLAQVRAHTPEVADACTTARDRRAFFESVRSISVDVGVLERSDNVYVLPGDFGWDDVGTWSALRRVLPLDDSGNAVRGAATLVDSRDNVVYSRDTHVVLYGVNDLVIVSCGGITLVTSVELSSDLKALLESVPPGLKDG